MSIGDPRINFCSCMLPVLNPDACKYCCNNPYRLQRGENSIKEIVEKFDENGKLIERITRDAN